MDVPAIHTDYSQYDLKREVPDGYYPEGLDQEEIIRYRPNAGVERWLEQRFSSWNEAKAWFAAVLVVVFFWSVMSGQLVSGLNWLITHGLSVQTAGGSVAGYNTALLTWFVNSLAAIVAALSLLYEVQPTHLRLTKNGVRLHWKRLLIETSGPLFEWNGLNHIYLSRPAGRTTVQDAWLCLKYNGGRVFKIKLSGVTKIDDRQRLLKAIDQYAPTVACDHQIMEFLSPPQNHNYTELWLQALTAAPKRERLAPLPEGCMLKDGRYMVICRLGVGGQGTAYLCKTHLDDGRELAVVLKESILPVYVDMNVRKQALEKFQSESEILRRLNHPQIVKLLDYFVEDHRSYLVLEHIDGTSLRDLVQATGPLSEERVAELAVQMCDILNYLHGLSPPVVHRDFTPDNLILAGNGILKLIDFQVAQQTESTATGTVVGKHAYLPPEQFRGKPTSQSDIYAMGATLYYLLVGEDPEPISVSHPQRSRPHISSELDAVIAKATAINAEGRYSSVDEVKKDILSLQIPCGP